MTEQTEISEATKELHIDLDSLQDQINDLIDEYGQQIDCPTCRFQNLHEIVDFFDQLLPRLRLQTAIAYVRSTEQTESAEHSETQH